MDSSLVDTETLRTQLIDSLGLTNVPPEEQEALLQKISEAIMDRVGISIMTHLNEEQMDAASALMNAGDSAGLREYMQSVIPAFDEFVQTEVTRAIVDYQKLLISTAGEGTFEEQ
jgi:hypothetical protein